MNRILKNIAAGILYYGTRGYLRHIEITRVVQTIHEVEVKASRRRKAKPSVDSVNVEDID